jgi:hypothetical protein
VLCQLKSTDANSIKIVKQDIDTLNYHALVEHKLPVFAIQFIKSNDVYLLVKPEDICDLVNYIKYKEVTSRSSDLISGELLDNVNININKHKVKSSEDSRKDFESYNKGKFKKEKKAK